IAISNIYIAISNVNRGFTAPPPIDRIRRMHRRCACALVIGAAASCALFAAPLDAQTMNDPVVGNWRGTLTSSAGSESAIIITIVKKGDVYAGSTSGLNATSESPLRRVTAKGARLSIEAAAQPERRG